MTDKPLELPAPLVAVDVDLRDEPMMPLAVDRLRDSRFAAVFDAEAFRAGVLLWCASWHQVPCGSLPTDEFHLAQLAGFGRDVGAWREVSEEALHGFVRCSDGRLYHPEVCDYALCMLTARRRGAQRA